MAYENNGKSRSLKIEVYKTVGGQPSQPYPRVYNAQFAGSTWGYDDITFPALSDIQARRLSDADYLTRITALQSYITSVEGATFPNDVVGPGPTVASDPLCIPTTTTTTMQALTINDATSQMDYAGITCSAIVIPSLILGRSAQAIMLQLTGPTYPYGTDLEYMEIVSISGDDEFYQNGVKLAAGDKLYANAGIFSNGNFNLKLIDIPSASRLTVLRVKIKMKNNPVISNEADINYIILPCLATTVAPTVTVDVHFTVPFGFTGDYDGLKGSFLVGAQSYNIPDYSKSYAKSPALQLAAGIHTFNVSDIALFQGGPGQSQGGEIVRSAYYSINDGTPTLLDPTVEAFNITVATADILVTVDFRAE